MQIDHLYPLLRHGAQEPLRKDMHPARQHHQVRLVLQHLPSQGGVVPSARLPQPRRILLAFGLEPARDHVEVLGRDAGLVGACHGIRSLAVDEQPDDLGVLDEPRGHAVEERLKVAPAAAGHDHDAAWGRRSHVGEEVTGKRKQGGLSSWDLGRQDSAAALRSRRKRNVLNFASRSRAAPPRHGTWQKVLVNCGPRNSTQLAFAGWCRGALRTGGT